MLEKLLLFNIYLELLIRNVFQTNIVYFFRVHVTKFIFRLTKCNFFFDEIISVT